jgi:hypothetical protein
MHIPAHARRVGAVLLVAACSQSAPPAAPTPTEVPYRGHSQRLFKRDFAGELMDRHPDLELVDHGFAWRRARLPQDDINWFLLEKRQRPD